MKRLDRDARRVAGIVLVVLLAIFLLAAWVVRHEPVAEVDRGARSLIRDAYGGVFKHPMRLVSLIGSGYVLLPVTVACSVGLWGRRQHALAAALPLLGLAAAVALVVTKWIVAKPRPSLRGYGFPSGHVFGVTVFVMIAVYLLWRFEAPHRWQQAARLGGCFFVLLVGVSRLYVNAHWLSDVVGGLLVGLAFAVAAMLVMDRHPRASY